MQTTSALLLSTAATLGLVHTLVGVDHSLPFVMLARAQRWTLRKLLWVTAACGVLHVGSSVLIGVGGVALGIALGHLQWLQQVRGQWAARLLIGLGLAYMVWGWVQLRRDRHHSHLHIHPDGTVHHHDHNHHGEHIHAHVAGMQPPAAATTAASGHRNQQKRVVTVAGLMLLFVLGPCEALVPLLVTPAYEGNWWLGGAVVAVFAAATLLVMLVLVTVGYYGMRWKGFRHVERYMHVAAGLAIALSGLAVEVLGI